jgi:hypothetical protein
MTDSELETFRQCTGRQNPPTKEPSELFTICGRRGGKSYISALTAVYLACFGDYRRYLNSGERAVILILARDREQARIVFNYVSGILHDIAPLAAMIDVERADEIELNNNVVIMVKTSDFRAIRGLTVAAAILDEVAFWDSEGISPDHEILTALRPATSTIRDAKIIAISTPYSESGSLYESYREFYGRDDEHTLVWVAESTLMNPTLDKDFIQRQIERDPEGATSEYLATFRTDVSRAFNPQSLDSCVIKDRDYLPPSPFTSYRAFCDPSGGTRDSFSLAVGHREEGEKVVIDLVREWLAPCSPQEVTAEISKVLKAYGCSSVTGDRFAGLWPVSEFHAHGISYEQCEQSKSELYLAFVPVVNSGGVELPDDKKLLTQFRRLERKRGRAGRDTVDHPPRLFDDLSNSVAGVSYLVSNVSENTRRDFSPAFHISRTELAVAFGNWPIVIGISYGDDVTASVIGQVCPKNETRVFCAYVDEGISLQRHLLERAVTWLRANAKQYRIMGGHEKFEDPGIKSEVWRTVDEIIPGEWTTITAPGAGGKR